jgi:heme-degrading monooxygenase HmoA
MFSVIFEVNRKPERQDAYLKLAMELKPILQTIDGFIDNERFESQIRKGWLLSHSTWRDEKSVVRWRTQAQHHEVQEKGRFDIFQDYHLRVGEIVHDTSPPSGLPVTEQRLDESQIAKATHATLTEIIPENGTTFGAQSEMLPAHLGLALDADGLMDHEVYKSLSAIYPGSKPYTPGKVALLLAWKNAAAAKSWTPKPFAGVKDLRHRTIRVIRDYGMFDRREAPQFYQDIKGSKTTLHAEPAH